MARASTSSSLLGGRGVLSRATREVPEPDHHRQEDPGEHDQKGRVQVGGFETKLHVRSIRIERTSPDDL